MRQLSVFLIFACMFISCESKKEVELQNREKAVTLREEEFEKKEADYKALVLMRDSLSAIKDTVKNNPDLIKEWPKSIKGFRNLNLIRQEFTLMFSMPKSLSAYLKQNMLRIK